jgi:NAD(P)-dependent dehydrogenase (short-subunit alcohol dehydrogenase family)
LSAAQAEKVAVVTGAASGNGKAIAERLSTDGYEVLIVDVDAKRGAAVAESLTKAGGRVKFVACDVADESAVEKMSHAAAECGGVDALVNNAGIGLWGTAESMEPAAWDKVMAVNVRSVFFVSKYVLPLMRGRKEASVVNIGSGAGVIGVPNSLAYCASKGAVIAATRAMALDLAKDGIRVNCVCPGVVDTPFNDQVLATVEDPEATRAAQAAAHPLGRLGTPEDVAGAVAYLVSSAAAFVTGAVLMVDGGLTAQ